MMPVKIKEELKELVVVGGLTMVKQRRSQEHVWAEA
jgi:hypothetical protein